MRVADLLRTSDLFEHWSSDELDQLARGLREEHFERGHVLCRQGDPAEAMFIIADGCVEAIMASHDGSPRAVRQLTHGHIIGDIALFSGDAQPATATALTDGRVHVLPKATFETLVADRPSMMRDMLTAVSRRAARANRQVAAEKSSTAPISAGGRVYCVCSPRGGAGKTTLTIALGLRLSSALPERVGLLDLDLTFADAALLLDLDPARPLASVPPEQAERLDPRMLTDYVAHHESGLRVVVAAARPEDGERITAGHVQGTLSSMRRQYLATVVDGGSSFGKPALAALESADKVVVVCTPELTTLRDLRDYKRVLGGEKTRVVFVLNHTNPSTSLSRAKFEAALEQEIAVEFPYAGESARTHSGFLRALDALVQLIEPANRALKSSARAAEPVRGPRRLLQFLPRPRRAS